MDNIKLWETARYLIDAKKDIDSIIFMRDNLFQISEEIRREYVARIRDHFFIRSCVVLDRYVNCSKISKKELCSKFPIVENLYYERDKNSAHSDDNYQMKEYETLDEMILEMKCQIKQVKSVCSDILPENITLDFVSHDKVLFRLLHGIDYKKEEKLKDIKHSNRRQGFARFSNLVDSKKILNDIKEIRSLTESQKNEYAVELNAGLNALEGLQNRQDFAIQVNVTFNQNMWVYLNENDLHNYIMLKRTGFLDKYDIPRVLNVYSNEFLKRVYRIIYNGDFNE